MCLTLGERVNATGKVRARIVYRGSLMTLCRRTVAITAFRRNCVRFSSTTAVGKGSFPLKLPSDFKFTSHSIVYSNGHPTVPVVSPKSIPIQNPATEEILQYIDCASPETVNSAVGDAHRIFKSGEWSRADPNHRFQVLTRTANLLREHSQELAACTPPFPIQYSVIVETLQTGRPIREMTAQLSRLPEWFEYHASLARTHQTDVLPFKVPPPLAWTNERETY